MRTKLVGVKQKLKRNSFRLHTLSPDEVTLYMRYRLGEIVRGQLVLTKREIRYLLCETGYGSLRFDPALIDPLLTEEIYELFALEEERKEKLHISSLVERDRYSVAMQANFQSDLSTLIKKLKLLSQHPFLFDGTLHAYPIRILIMNGEWVMPNELLFAFLNGARSQERFPLVIAEKIHGVLFPYFKAQGIFGFNTYQALVSDETLTKYNIFEKQDKELRNLRIIKYREPLTDTISDVIKASLARLSPGIMQSSYEKFLASYSPTGLTFTEKLSVLKNPLKRKLTKWHTWHQACIAALKANEE